MGLDLAVGGLVLLMAVRGWSRGFLLQAIRLGGLVGCVYAADPVRGQVRPYAREYLPTIEPALLDRLLWWTSAVACYVVMVGVASLVLKSFRGRAAYFEPDQDRNDRLAGLLLGAAKGAVAATFVVAAVQDYALDYLKSMPWVEDQVRDSYALEWNREYQPAPRIWAAPPVQHFVGEIRRMGLRPADPSASARAEGPSTSFQTADRSPRLNLAGEPLDGP